MPRRRPNPPLAILANPQGKPLAREVYELAYQHAEDGRAYKHEFKRGVRATLNRDGSVTLRHRDRKPLWRDYPERPYLVNPEHRPMKKKVKRRPAATSSRRAKRKPPRGFASWSAYMASIRPTTHKGGLMARTSKKKHRAKRARRHSVTHHSAVRSVRRRYRRNPPAGIVAQVMDGLKGGALVTVGEVGVKLVPGFLGVNTAGSFGLAIEAGIALGLAIVTGKAISSDAARFVLAGGFAAPMKGLLKQFNVPVIGPALADYSPLGGYSRATAALPAAPQELHDYADAMSAPALQFQM